MEELTAAIDADLAWAEALEIADISHRFADLGEVAEADFEEAVYEIASRYQLNEAAVRLAATKLARERFGVESPETLLQWVLLLSAIGEDHLDDDDAKGDDAPADTAQTRLYTASQLLDGKTASSAQFDAWVTLGDWEEDEVAAAGWYRKAIDASAADERFPRPSTSTTVNAMLAVAATGDIPWALGALAFGRNTVATMGGAAPAERDALALGEVMIFETAGEWEHAHRAAERARLAMRRKLGPWEPVTIDALTVEIHALTQLGRPADAKRVLEPLLAEHRKAHGAPLAAGAKVALLLADTLIALGNAAGGEALRNSTIAKLEASTGAWEKMVLEAALDEDSEGDDDFESDEFEGEE
jgi:hypothetical protein